MKHVIVDTDPGDDDASAILWCLASKNTEVDAIFVTHGNVELEKCVTNALRIVEVAKRTDIPVYAGAERPILRPQRFAHWIHAEDGLGDAGVPLPKLTKREGIAAVEMVRHIMEAPEPLTLLALGPLTNVAIAILIEPKIVEKLEAIVLMGGAVYTSGNESPAASFNLAVDPEAARIVYRSGAKIVQIGLDVCDQVTQTVDDLDAITGAHTPVTDFLTAILEFRRTKAVKKVRDESGSVVRQIQASGQVPSRGRGIGLNDLTTAAYVINPQWFDQPEVFVDVEIHGDITAAKTIADFMGLWGKEPNGIVPMNVDGGALVKQWVGDMIKFDPK